MSQPESTERCADCGRPRSLSMQGCNAYNDPDGTDCMRLCIERLRRALAEAETLKRISDSQAHEAWIERDGALARLAEAEKELRAAAGPNLTDGFSDNATLVEHVARLRLIVDNHEKQCGDFVVQRNSAWRRLVEMGKAKKAAEERAAQAERALRAVMRAEPLMRAARDYATANAAPRHYDRPRAWAHLCDVAVEWARTEKSMPTDGAGPARAALQEASKASAPKGPSEADLLLWKIPGGAQGEEK